MIDLMAVAEFLENVDMAGLGLEDSEKMRSVVANLYFSYNTSDPSYFIIVLYHLIHFGSHASRGLPNRRNVTLVTIILAKCQNHLEIRNKCLKILKKFPEAFKLFLVVFLMYMYYLILKKAEIFEIFTSLQILVIPNKHLPTGQWESDYRPSSHPRRCATRMQLNCSICWQFSSSYLALLPNLADYLHPRIQIQIPAVQC